MMRHIRFEFENTEPLRIGDDETSQHGQTDTLRFIPGSAVRGMVIQSLLEEEGLFESCKRLLFSDHVHFMNAYPMAGGRDLIPSLKGFYEDKTESKDKKAVENVLLADLTPGTKRASLGRYCYVDGDCLRYTDVKVGETLHINRGREGKKTLFHGQFLEKGQRFSGFITLDDQVDGAMAERILGALKGRLCFGNRRSAGYGACRLLAAGVREGAPYGAFRWSGQEALSASDSQGEGVKDFYLALLSDTTMRDEYGGIAGLCLPELARLLDCEGLKLLRCATSKAESHGYSRVWRGAVPSVVMYSAGSVFHLEAERPVNPERFRLIEEQGIGIRRNEGFGQVAVLRGYEAIGYKLAIGDKKAAGNDAEGAAFIRAFGDGGEDLRIAARGFLTGRIKRAMERYMVEHPLRLKGISNSKLGVVTAMCQELQYTPMEAKDQLERFIGHSKEKDERSKIQGASRKDALHSYLHSMLDGDLYEILGLSFEGGRVFGIPLEEILPQEERMRCILNLIIGQIRYANREVKSSGR